MTEKELGRVLNVQFTPTLLFFDEKGTVVARLNGYWPPQRFEPVLDYVAEHHERSQTLPGYLGVAAREPASRRLHNEPFFLKPPHDLRRAPGSKALAVIFETVDCSPCDELHGDVFRRPEVLAQVARFDVVRFSIGAHTEVTTPAGHASTAQAWARELGVVYAPSIVLFDGGTEALRLESSLGPFHVASALDYVASRAYRTEPSFQRFVQARADAMRARGERVDFTR